MIEGYDNRMLSAPCFVREGNRLIPIQVATERPEGPQARKQAERRSCPKDTCTGARSDGGAASVSEEIASPDGEAQP